MKDNTVATSEDEFMNKMFTLTYMHENSSGQCQKKEGENPGQEQLFSGFSPSSPQSFPGTVGLT